MAKAKRMDDVTREKVVSAMYNSLKCGATNSGLICSEAHLMFGISDKDAIECFKSASNILEAEEEGW